MPPTPARHHAEWLSLLEISGPFLSMPVLLAAFPQGLDDFPPEEARSLRADYEYWKENPADPAVHTAWVRLVLESMLGYTGAALLSGQAIPGGMKAEFPEHEETLRPDLMLVEPGTHKPRLLIQVYPPGQSLDKALRGSRWQASLATRMMELLHATEIRLGLITNGEQWMLVDAPRGETSGFTAWYANLWFDESLTLRALRSLLGVRRFFGVPADETLESLLAKSAQDQQEITDQLGLQVRHAVEILIQSLDRADQDQGRNLLGTDLPPDLLYEAALTVMMRLVFMLSAEERKLLPIDDDRYAAYYAVSTLREQLQTQADLNGEDVLERRYDAWSRLLAVFRAVHGGIHHQDLHSPAYGGSLFDPQRFPFLEGRRQAADLPPASVEQEAPLPVNNRTVLHLLDALQMLQVPVPGGAVEKRRLSFRALDVEQIGHVYEGLLDHKATRASEPILGLKGTKNLEPEVTLSALERAKGKGETAFLDWLHEQTGRSVTALKNALTGDLFQSGGTDGRLRSVCADEALFQRVLPFAGLLRTDDLAFPVVILPGSVYVTAGTTRRATGTHYTPRALTEPIVQHTLEPLVYQGPAEGWPRAEWRLLPAADLLSLKVCDMAMGSAGFLVQVVRYLSERLVEAWGQYGTGQAPEEADRAGIESSAFYQAAAALTPDDQLLYARRLVAERCIYGVDKNHLAVEIAKLSLWLVTLSKDLPFTFLNHALKCGDSLVGASTEDFLRWANRKKRPEMSLDQEVLREELDKALRLRKLLESFVVRDVQDAARKDALLLEAEAAMEHVKRGADLLTGIKLLGLRAQEAENLQVRLVDPYIAGELDGEIDMLKHTEAAHALHAALKENAFHWPFEFPEVFERGGFNAFVGNPPFRGGLMITRDFNLAYTTVLKSDVPEASATTDLCAYFFRKAYTILSAKGCLGMIATNSISEGDTRDASLLSILNQKGAIIYAFSSFDWPGEAALHVAIIVITKMTWHNLRILDGYQVENINSGLKNAPEVEAPKQLLGKITQAYLGTTVYGTGFFLSKYDEQKLIQIDESNKIFIRPFLNGEDVLNARSPAPSRKVLYFQGMTLQELQKYPSIYEYANENIYPQRQKSGSKNRRENWWLYTSPAEDLYSSIQEKKLSRVLVTCFTSKYVVFVFQQPEIIFSNAIIVISTEKYSDFSLLQSTFHSVWVHEHSSTLETRQRYALSDCYDTYPNPKYLMKDRLENVGSEYYQFRSAIMMNRDMGLTSTYNNFHNPKEKSADIARLRELHVEMDNAVAAAYGWSDLELGHGFHETAQGLRYTISEAARREVLSRLLKLNRERYEEEVKAGLHEKKGAGGKKPSPKGRGSSEEGQAAKQPSSKGRGVKEQPSLLDEYVVAPPPEPPAQESTPAEQIGSWDQCVCLGCGKHLVGFSVEEHTKKVHGGKDPGYRKIGKD